MHHLVLSGTPSAIGEIHGETLRADIADCVGIYRDIFQLDDDALSARAMVHRQAIADAPGSTPYLEEIAGIARGSGQPEYIIHALNARSELMADMYPEINECTAVYFAQTALLGQNWDWNSKLESLFVLMEIHRPDGHRLMTITEPGMLAKIGISSAGVGVCLNFMSSPHELRGLPIHIVLRAILDAGNFNSAITLARHAGPGRSGNVMIGSDSGEAITIEYLADERLEFEPEDGTLLHTNHSLGMSPEDETLSTSQRYADSCRWCIEHPERDLSALQSLLSAKAHPEYPVLREYCKVDGRMIGTLCTIAMDLPARELHLRIGHDESQQFSCYRLYPD